MAKNKKGSSLGRQIIKDRFGKKNRSVGDSFLHTSDLKDGYDWGRLNLQSVTDQNNLEEFLSTAELAGTEFTAEKQNVKFVTSDTYGGIPQGEDLKKIHGLHKEHQKLLRIPRRPPWNKGMSASQLDQLEREAFLEWRRSLASLQEVEGLVMTPYEKNLDFWRQLWRVIERSDIVVQIVDARNPLLFYCPDLEQYVQEVDKNKVCLLLINKADFLTQPQRDIWANHFTKRGVRIAFWSALEEAKRQEKQDNEEQKDPELDSNDSTDEEADDIEDEVDTIQQRLNSYSAINDDNPKTEEEGDDDDGFVDKYGNKITGSKVGQSNISKPGNSGLTKSVLVDNIDKQMPLVDHSAEIQDENVVDKMDKDNCDIAGKPDTGALEDSQDSKSQSTEKTEVTFQDDSVGISSQMEMNPENKDDKSKRSCDHKMSDRSGSSIQNSGKIYFGEELLDLFRNLHSGKKVQPGITTVGMVGYPNVGKSSTINAILRMKKVPVSATPGRTKHFQTLFVDPELMLCDCPGLVFPSFVTTKADLVVSGILPIDQMRDHVPPTSLVCQLIPRQTLSRTYGIIIPDPGEAEDPSRPPTAHELLNSYGAMRGFMTARGVPDCPRSSRYILKDYVNGKLLYCHPPPDVDPVIFNPVHLERDLGAGDLQEQAMGNTSDVVIPSLVDNDFFRKVESTVHSRTARGGAVDTMSSRSPLSSQSSLTEKPWKRHNNRKKKEKLRRVYAHLDN